MASNNVLQFALTFVYFLDERPTCPHGTLPVLLGVVPGAHTFVISCPVSSTSDDEVDRCSVQNSCMQSFPVPLASCKLSPMPEQFVASPLSTAAPTSTPLYILVTGSRRHLRRCRSPGSGIGHQRPHAAVHSCRLSPAGSSVRTVPTLPIFPPNPFLLSINIRRDGLSPPAPLPLQI